MKKLSEAQRWVINYLGEAEEKHPKMRDIGWMLHVGLVRTVDILTKRTLVENVGGVGFRLTEAGQAEFKKILTGR